jgi:hypothetical protein
MPMTAQAVRIDASHDAARLNRPDPLATPFGTSGFFQRDHSIHPPAHAPG